MKPVKKVKSLRAWRERRLAEERLDRMIDALNEERRPPQPGDPETAELLVVARMLRAMREPAAPSPAFPQRLRAAVERQVRAPRRWFVPAAAALVAALVLIAVFVPWPGLPWAPQGDVDVVHAMERAVAGLQSYHGVLEKRAFNAAGEQWLVRRTEIWAEGDKYATRDDTGVLTVNDGERRWQVRPAERLVVVLPLLPDPRAFDLHDEARRALQYPHEVMGAEQVAGREAVRVRITPPGGLPYDLWVDAHTHLPLRLRTAMQNGLQTETTFVRLEANAPVDPSLFTFRVPEGYRVQEDNPGQLVDTPAEAAAIAGFTPLMPDEPPSRILAARERVVLEYGETVIVEEPARGAFEPAPNGAVGSAGDAPLEVLSESLRWRQQGLEIRVEGPRRVELARAIAPDLKLPEPGGGGSDDGFSPQVQVSVDMEIERNSQQQVDRGSSPWMVDPAQVAAAFLLGRNTKGIGDPAALVDEHVRVTRNDGVRAVVEVEVGEIARVYLERLVRQDETGIWTVVGYDRR